MPVGVHAGDRPAARAGLRHAACRARLSRGLAPDGERIAMQIMYQLYPSNVRKWLDRHSGLLARMILFEGRELAANGAVLCWQLQICGRSRKA
jgi:hypothetical protein